MRDAVAVIAVPAVIAIAVVAVIVVIAVLVVTALVIAVITVVIAMTVVVITVLVVVVRVLSTGRRRLGALAARAAAGERERGQRDRELLVHGVYVVQVPGVGVARSTQLPSAARPIEWPAVTSATFALAGAVPDASRSMPVLAVP